MVVADVVVFVVVAVSCSCGWLFGWLVGWVMFVVICCFCPRQCCHVWLLRSFLCSGLVLEVCLMCVWLG